MSVSKIIGKNIGSFGWDMQFFGYLAKFNKALPVFLFYDQLKQDNTDT